MEIVRPNDNKQLSLKLNAAKYVATAQRYEQREREVIEGILE
jgi:hypothetical protein